jgi:hypothetical protein
MLLTVIAMKVTGPRIRMFDVDGATVTRTVRRTIDGPGTTTSVDERMPHRASAGDGSGP